MIQSLYRCKNSAIRQKQRSVPQMRSNHSLKQTHGVALNFIAIINLCLFSFMVQANGNISNLICSTQLGNTIQGCPANKEQYASSFSQVPQVHTNCDSKSNSCFEAQSYGITTDYFTFFDIDANTTTKYAVLVSPTFFNSDNSVRQQGYKETQIISPTDDELAVTEGFNDVINKKNHLDTMLRLTRSPNNAVTETSGLAGLFTDKIKEKCTTAIEYLSSYSGCTGYMNGAIDRAVENHAAFQDFISAMDQLQTTVSAVVETDVTLSEINELTKFWVKVVMSDDSVLVVNFKLKQGSVEITTNMHASRTSEHRTFAQALDSGIYRSSSMSEATSISTNLNIPIMCEPINLSDTQYTLVDTISIAQPNGARRVVNIYAKETYFYVYQHCG